MTQLGYRKPNFWPTSSDSEAVKRNGFHDLGVLVVNINDKSLPWQDRELLKMIGERLYGKKPAGKSHGREQQ